MNYENSCCFLYFERLPKAKRGVVYRFLVAFLQSNRAGCDLGEINLLSNAQVEIAVSSNYDSPSSLRTGYKTTSA